MPNLRTRITNVAWREASVAAIPELADKRLDIISRYRNPLQRMGARGLHAFAHYTSGSILSHLATPYEAQGMSVIGSGWNSTVLRDGDTAIKIVRRTELMSPEGRARHIEHLRRLIGYNAACHPGIALTSEVNEIPHPLTGRPVVAITQPHLEGVDALSEPIRPEVREQLREFAERSLDTMPHGVAPDLVGPRNILVSGPEGGSSIQLVDTVALEDLDIPHATYPYSVKILNELAHSRSRVKS